LAVKVFEFSQTFADKWHSADYAEKRRILEIVCLNFRLDDATLVPEIRKPFDVLVKEQFVQSSRGDKTPLELFCCGVRQWHKTLWSMTEELTHFALRFARGYLVAEVDAAALVVFGPRDAVPSGIVALLGDIFDNPGEEFAIDRRAGHQNRNSITTILM
jgi:hypothetical protein